MTDDMNTASILTDQLDRLLTAKVGRSELQQGEAGTFPQALWGEIEALGLSLALVSEEAGGVGLSWSDLVDPIRLAGYHATPVPLVETMLSSWILGLAGIAIPAGISVPIEEQLAMDAAGSVTGICENVAWGEVAGHFVCIAMSGKNRQLCLLSAEGAAIEQRMSIGRDPRSKITFRSARPVAIAEMPPTIAEIGIGGVLAAVRCAQIAGALSRTLEMAIEYGNTRVQFGRPIGKFQALQHMMAVFACEAAAAGVAAAMALRSLDAGNPLFAVAAAKVRCGTAATKGTTAAHAIHGAIGVTEEHSLHYLTRRLWQWRDEAGSEHAWAERLSRMMLSRSGASLWPTIVAAA